MSDDAPQTPPAPAPDAETAPQIRVLAQYVKDVSFENPGAPEALRAGNQAPNIDLTIDVRAKRMEDGPYEVVVHVEARAERENTVSFIVDLKYAGLFHFVNIPEQNLEPVLLVECPRMLFPFVRRIASDLTRDGGFPPLYIDPIDFMALYRQQIAKRGAAAAGSPGAAGANGGPETGAAS